MIVALAESGAVYGPIKRKKQLECHPMRKYLQECEEEWMEYGKRWQAPAALCQPLARFGSAVPDSEVSSRPGGALPGGLKTRVRLGIRTAGVQTVVPLLFRLPS